MPAITLADLKAHMRTGEYDRLYFIYGNEGYLKRCYMERLVKKCVDKDFADFNLHIFDGKGINIKDVAMAAQALPMMSERTCVLIKDIKASDLSESDKKELLSLVSDIPETCVIVICLLTCDAEGKGWKELITAFNKYGSTLKLDKMSRQELSRYVVKGAQTRGAKISPALADYFISLTGDDLSNVINELDKLCANSSNSEITEKNIDAVTVKTAEVRIFELSKNLVAGNSSKAYAILDSLIKQREEPIFILATIITSFVDMYRAKVFLAGGHRAEEAAKVFNYGKNDFRLRNAAKNASGLSVSQLRKSLDVLSKADESLKSTSLDGRTVLEEAMMKLFLIANGEEVC